MAMKRVIAHFMHEYEEAAAHAQLHNAQPTESYVLGETDEAGIEGLRQSGLIVQVLDNARGPALPRAAAAEAAVMAGTAISVDLPLRAALEVESEVATAGDLLTVETGGPGVAGAAQEQEFYLVSLDGPLLETWRAELEGAGASIEERAEGSSYVVRMTGDAANTVLGLSFVTGLSAYGVGHSLATAALGGGPPGRPGRLVTWDLWLHRAEDRPAVEQELIIRNLYITGSAGRKVRVAIPDNAPATVEVAGLPAVARMEEFVPPELHNDAARVILGIEDGQGGSIGLTGQGQVVAVADTGIDDAHPDFGNRIVQQDALGRFGDTSDPNGHGTHVSGSVLGDGAASNGQFRGIAPSASLYFQSLLDASGRLGGLPVSLDDLFDPPYQAGARIHNDSWGSATASRYTIDATEVDAYVASHRDLLIVISAGNSGIAEPRRNSQPGFVDWLSIGSPASCKNALTVGASRSNRNSGGLSSLTYGQVWPGEYPAPPIAGDAVSGDPEAIAAFSSRGPCDDRRIKPDVVGPGTDILSTRSTAAPLRNFWGAHANARYAYMGGTSMSAPLVAGCAALVRQYLVDSRNHLPSAALLKAILINGTRWLSGTDAVADFALPPNFNQGFGAVFLPWSIPSPLDPSLQLEFADTWQTPARQFLRTGQRFQYRITVNGGARLRIALVYTDTPGRGLQNNLDLTVEGPGPTKWVGNKDLPMSLNIPDPDNNVEIVRLDNPPPGDYLLQVSAWNILQPPQDFALVVAGDLGSSLDEL